MEAFLMDEFYADEEVAMLLLSSAISLSSRLNVVAARILPDLTIKSLFNQCSSRQSDRQGSCKLQ